MAHAQTPVVPRALDHIMLHEREIDEHWPNVNYQWFQRGSGHYWIEVEFNGRKRGMTVPATPSDGRSGLNSRGDLRKLLSSIGATRIANEKSQREKKHRPTCAREVVAHRGLPDPRTGGLQELIKPNDAGYAAMRRWDGVRIKPGVEMQAAVELISAWHPDIITEAAELIRKYAGRGDKK